MFKVVIHLFDQATNKDEQCPVAERTEKRNTLNEEIGQTVTKSTVPQGLQVLSFYVSVLSAYKNFSFILRENDSVLTTDLIFNLTRISHSYFYHIF